MSFVTRIRLSITLDGSGAYTGIFPDPIVGKIKQIVYTKPGSGTTFGGSQTITLTNKETGETIWSEASLSASAVRAPRIPTHTTAGVASLFAAAGTAVNDEFHIGGDHVQAAVSGGTANGVGIIDLIVA